MPRPHDLADELAERFIRGTLTDAITEMIDEQITDYEKCCCRLIALSDCVKRAFDGIDVHAWKRGDLQYSVVQLNRARDYLDRVIEVVCGQVELHGVKAKEELPL